MNRTRRKFSANFKTKVVLEALKNEKTLQEIASKYEVHSTQISSWKSEFLEHAPTIFEHKQTSKSEIDADKERLFKVIGEQKVEIDFLKHVLGK